MHPSLKQIADYGIPVHSYIRAIQHLTDRPPLSYGEYDSRSSKLVRSLVKSPDEKMAKYTYLYLIQETVRAASATVGVDPSSFLQYAISRASAHIESNPWLFVQPDNFDSSDTDPTVSRSGNSSKKGAKQDIVEQIYRNHRKTTTKADLIDMFVEQAGMTKSGASTYFYAMKKKHGVEMKPDPTTPSNTPQKMNKTAIAALVYKKHMDTMTKEQIIAQLVEALQTSDAGATTYFYAMKKKMGDPTVSKKSTPANNESKSEKAYRIYSTSTVSKDEMIAQFMEVLDTSKAGATTQYYAAKKRFLTA